MEYKKALSKCMQMCSRKEYCITDIKQKLINWDINNVDADKIVATLQDEKFIDEERFVNAFVNDKFKFNKWGKKKISFALAQKGLSKHAISKGLKQIDVNEYKELILELITDKAKKVTAGTEFERNGKIANFLASRGFEADLIFKYLNSDDY